MQQPFSGERIVISINAAGKIGYPYVKKKSFDTCLIPYTNIHARQVTDISVKSKSRKSKESLWDLELGKDYLDMTCSSKNKLVNLISSKIRTSVL